MQTLAQLVTTVSIVNELNRKYLFYRKYTYILQKVYLLLKYLTVWKGERWKVKAKPRSTWAKNI